MRTDFELKDQNGVTLNVAFPREKVCVLVFGDRDGSKQVEGWVRPLVEHYDDRVDVRGVAVLKGVPAFLRAVVRRVIKSRVRQPVMLDWSGKVSKLYGYEGGELLLVVLDREGRVVAEQRGAASPEKVRAVVSKVNEVLRPPAGQ